MTTKLYPIDNAAETPPAGSPNRGFNDSNLRGTPTGWGAQGLRTTPSAGPFVSQITASIAGPTAGIEVGGASPVEFVSEPLAAGVTISGTITFNLWGLESGMAANAGFLVVVERLDSQGQVAATISSSAIGVELGTADAVNNWTATPTSTAMSAGDRIRIRIAYDDIGTMASGFNLGLSTGSATGGTDGDSWIQFNETITFLQSDPAGSKLYLTNTAAGINPGAATELEAWTTAGASSQNSVTNTQNGFVAPIQVTDTGGGTALEWYSRQLAAFTLSGMAFFNVRAKNGGVAAGVIRGEVAVCASDGSAPSIWGASGEQGVPTNTDGAQSCYVAGVNTTIVNGQRLRFRVYIDDSDIAMVSGATMTVSYNGNSAGAAGDTYVTLPQSVTEFVSVSAPGSPFQFKPIPFVSPGRI